MCGDEIQTVRTTDAVVEPELSKEYVHKLDGLGTCGRPVNAHRRLCVQAGVNARLLPTFARHLASLPGRGRFRQ